MIRQLKSLALAPVVLILCAPSGAFAGPCDETFASINSWLEGDHHFVRVVSTFTKPDNEVAYTRGYLESDENRQGWFNVASIRYFNTTSEPPFNSATADHVTLELRQDGPLHAQVVVTPDANPASAASYSAECSDKMLIATPSTGGVLALSFRFD